MHLTVAELVPGITALLLIAVAVRAFSKRFDLPFTVMLVVAGIALAQLTHYGPSWLHEFRDLNISSEVFLLIFLPTLVFESAFNLDSRLLRQNLVPVLLLAVPGVLISTALFGGLLWLATPLSLEAALILGAILSATDPVAVIALFKQLGAPKRLTVLVEGESLFNDATAIVLTRILIAVALSGHVSGAAVFSGVLSFFGVFLGGLLVGVLAALLVGFVLGLVENDPFIEVPLTVVLAYFSFVLAEEFFHVSGVMAVVAAGLVMGGWGRTKISPEISHYLTELWEYFAFMANALIFLLVGLLVDLPTLFGSMDLLLWVIVGMLLSRIVVVYALVPLAERLPNAQPVSLQYQTVMYWGGLRGAIALALVLSLPDFPYKQSFIAVTTGAVLFTLLVQGLSIGPLVKRLGLDKAPLGDRLTGFEVSIASIKRALRQIHSLSAGGLFSASIAEDLDKEYQEQEKSLRRRQEELRHAELDDEQERRLLFLRCFSAEKSAYYEMFSKGHLSERTYRDLIHSIDLQSDSMRCHGTLPRYTLHLLIVQRFNRFILRLLERLGYKNWLENYSRLYTIRDYERTWAQYQGGAYVLETLEEIKKLEPVPAPLMRDVYDTYEGWRNGARRRLDDTAEQFPEFAASMQERLGRRTLMHEQREFIKHHLHAGTLPAGIGEELLEKLDEDLRRLRGWEGHALKLDPTELLRKVPFFQNISQSTAEKIVAELQAFTVPPNEYIIRQGENGASLFLIARGVVRISRRTAEGTQEDLATLMAGNFFGEGALLHSEPRSATCRAVTTCALYELNRRAFEKVSDFCPELQEILHQTDAKRV